MKKTNLTLSLEADLVREAKVLAARRRAIARLARGFELEWSKPSSRHELHER